MKIKFVNGFKIRNTIDTDFVGHFTSDYAPYVPKDEVWIEDCLKPEKDLFIYLVEMEEKFSKQNKTFSQLRDYLMKEAQARKPRPEFRRKVVVRGEFKIVYVDGSIVRKFIDPYFIAGGHDLVYKYIPQNEIWIDDRNYKKDQPFALIHELHERKLMANGMDYDSAHDFALAEERYWRRKKKVADFIRG